MCEISTKKQIYCGKRNSGDVVTSRFFVVIVVCLLCVASCNYIYRLSFSHGVKMFILSASVMIEEWRSFSVLMTNDTFTGVGFVCLCDANLRWVDWKNLCPNIVCFFLKKFYLFVHKILLFLRCKSLVGWFEERCPYIVCLLKIIHFIRILLSLFLQAI